MIIPLQSIALPLRQVRFEMLATGAGMPFDSHTSGRRRRKKKEEEEKKMKERKRKEIDRFYNYLLFSPVSSYFSRLLSVALGSDIVGVGLGRASGRGAPGASSSLEGGFERVFGRGLEGVGCGGRGRCMGGRVDVLGL